jgi:hypothetical protein
MRSLTPSENDIQATFVQQVLLEHRLDPTFKPILFYAVLNGPWLALEDKKRKDGLIEKYMSEGWKAGIPDIHYDQPRGMFNKLVFEFKKGKRRNEKLGGLSDEQAEYLGTIAPHAFARVIYTVDEGIAAFNEYMSLPVWGPSPIEPLINQLVQDDLRKGKR